MITDGIVGIQSSEMFIVLKAGVALRGPGGSLPGPAVPRSGGFASRPCRGPPFRGPGGSLPGPAEARRSEVRGK